MNIGNHHVVIIDGHNFMHRARSGWATGEFSVVFNFFRSLRSLVETLKPTRVCLVLEGKPVARLEEFAEYKANRKIADDDPDREAKVATMVDFHRQKDVIVDILKANFPMAIMRHAQHECDDVIYNIIKTSSMAVDFTVVSNDSDFTQLLNEFSNVKIYNPMKKEYVATPEYDYVLWKSLRGDGSDNIPGIPGIGDVRAAKLAKDPDLLKQFLLENKAQDRFATNLRLISFKTFSKQEMLDVTSSSPKRDWSEVKNRFSQMQFSSIVNDKSWKKFVDTFDPLFME